MSNPWGGGGSLITYPANNAWPAQVEYQKVCVQAANTNPFTGQQQIQDWQANYATMSVKMPPFNENDGQNWVYFLDLLNGIVNVFQFPTAFCTDPRYVYWATSDGTNPKYFRMSNPNYKVTVTPGGIYRITFEVREAT